MSEITLQNTKAEIFEAYQAKSVLLSDSLKENETLIAAKFELEKTCESLSSALAETEKQFDAFKASINDIPDEIRKTLSAPERVTVCIPYVKGLAQGNELQLALRGWDLNFKENFDVVIIGDREDWMNDLVHVIECERFSTNPPLDVVNKMMLAIESDLVTEKFIWANDDQYLVSPCMLADFEILKCAGRLGETNFGNTLYQQNKARTADLLLSSNLGTIDFSTHLPVVFEKQKLKEVIDKYNMTEDPHLVTTIYHNYWFPGFVPLRIDTPEATENDNVKVGVYRKGADLDRLQKLIPRKKVVSNSESGWSQKLSEILNSYFSFKCKFEN